MDHRPALVAAPVTPAPLVAVAPEPVGLRQRLGRTREALLGRLASVLGGRPLDETRLEELEALLFGADLGVATAEDLLARVRREAPSGGVEQVRAVLEKQESAWNRGRIDEFMETYEHSGRLVFTSGGQVERGWRPTLERYRKRYPDREAMGRLNFSDIEIRLIGDRAAVALGWWELHRRSR